MKKFLALILTTVMLLCSVSALAATEVNWADVEAAVASSGMEGSFTTFEEIACSVWVPTALQPIELTDEDREAGYIAYFMTEDGAAAMGVQYVNMDGITLEEYKGMLAEYGVTDAEDAVVNGLPAVTYSYTDESGMSSNVMALATEMGYIFELSFTAGDAGYESVSMLICASLQASN